MLFGWLVVYRSRLSVHQLTLTLDPSLPVQPPCPLPHAPSNPYRISLSQSFERGAVILEYLGFDWVFPANASHRLLGEVGHVLCATQRPRQYKPKLKVLSEAVWNTNQIDKSTALCPFCTLSFPDPSFWKLNLTFFLPFSHSATTLPASASLMFVHEWCDVIDQKQTRHHPP